MAPILGDGKLYPNLPVDVLAQDQKFWIPETTIIWVRPPDVPEFAGTRFTDGRWETMIWGDRRSEEFPATGNFPIMMRIEEME